MIRAGTICFITSRFIDEIKRDSCRVYVGFLDVMNIYILHVQYRMRDEINGSSIVLQQDSKSFFPATTHQAAAMSNAFGFI